MFKETNPVLGTRDIERAMDSYTKRLGFELAYRDAPVSFLCLGLVVRRHAPC